MSNNLICADKLRHGKHYTCDAVREASLCAVEKTYFYEKTPVLSTERAKNRFYCSTSNGAGGITIAQMI